MGSNPSKPGQSGSVPGNEARSVSTAPVRPPPVSGTSFEKFNARLEKLPFTLTEEQFETLIYDVVEKTFSPGDVVLQSGQQPVGLFFIISGICNVIASNGTTVLRYLKEDDFFGEMSSFYNNLCSCDIVCGPEVNCDVILLPFEKIQAFIKYSTILPIKHWIVQQKYIDTNAIFPAMDISQTIIKKGMLQTPLFYDWSEDAISLVYESVLPSPIEIYSPSEIIFFQEDQMPHGYLLISGEIEVFGKNSSIILHAKSESIWFGDEQLFSNNPKLLTAKARSPCHVVTFTSESFALITHEFVSETNKLMKINNYWRRHLNMRDHHLYEKYNEVMNMMFLSHNLRQSDIFNYSDACFMYYIALGTILRLVNKDDVIMVHDYSAECEPLIILILLGGGVVTKPDDDCDINLYPGDTFYFDKNHEPKSQIKAIEESLIGFISKSLIEDVKNIYPEALVNLVW